MMREVTHLASRNGSLVKGYNDMNDSRTSGEQTWAIRRQQQADKQYTKIQPFSLHGPGAKLFYAYSKLIECDRRTVEVLLEQHAFLLEGTNSYLLWDKWNESDRRWSYLHLLNTVSEEVAKAWFDWAKEISEGNPSRATCKEAILDVMCQLVRLKFLESPSHQGIAPPRT